MIQTDKIGKRFGPQVLFADLTWLIRPGDRIGLVGANGAGKTTLVRILAGLEPPDEGRVQQAKNATVGYLPQEAMEVTGGTVLEEALEGQGEVTALERQMHDLAHRLSSSPTAAESARWTEEYGELQDRFASLGGYDLETRAKTILGGLGFPAADFDRPVAELSGGWQMRVALACLLLQDPDLLLLDEPTNHLDLESLNWLEDFLRARNGAYVVISHDRYFLNRMVERIAELALGNLTLYTGNFDAYVGERERRFATVEAAARNQAKEIERTTRFIERFRYKSTKARQVQSRIKMLDKMEKVQVPVRDRQEVRFKFPQPPRSGALVMETTDLVKRYGDNVVYDGVHFRLQRGDRVALVGLNGAGKTTLLRVLAGVLGFESGNRTLGHNVAVSYYAQHALDALHPSNTVLAELSGAADTATQASVRGLLGAFLFDSEEWDKRVSVLSGGEKARLALAKMLLQPANLLLLDEPTNHLDLQSRAVLEGALTLFSGTLCFISHDRYFINKVATSVCEVQHGRLESYLGNYDEYRAQKEAREEYGKTGEPPPPTPPSTAGEAPDTAPATAPRLTRAQIRERKRREAEARQRFSLVTRPVRDKIEKLEKQIAAEETKLRAVEFELASPAVYQNPQKAKGAARMRDDLQARLAAFNAEWEKLSEEIEAADEKLRQEVTALAGG